MNWDLSYRVLNSAVHTIMGMLGGVILAWWFWFKCPDKRTGGKE